jgi:hypothetical protein
MIELALGVIIGLLSILVSRLNFRDFVAWTIMKDTHQYMNEHNKIIHPDEMADWSYQMADAMIKEKDKK